MRFQYRAARADGHIERGVMLAADQAELGRRLARHGRTPFFIFPAPQGKMLHRPSPLE